MTQPNTQRVMMLRGAGGHTPGEMVTLAAAAAQHLIGVGHATPIDDDPNDDAEPWWTPRPNPLEAKAKRK